MWGKGGGRLQGGRWGWVTHKYNNCGGKITVGAEPVGVWG